MLAYKKYLKFLILSLPAISMLILGACYDVDKPIGGLDNAVFNERLIGHWVKNTDGSASRPAAMTISGIASREYKVNYDDAGVRQLPFQAHVNRIAGIFFVNVRSTKDLGKENYSLFSYTFGEGKNKAEDLLTVRMMKVSLPVFKTNKELVNFVSRYSQNPDYLFEKGMVFRRG